jgi:hypothetical protein
LIRTIALGVVCLAGLGAIAAPAMKSTLPQSAKVVFPVVAGIKADRLPIKSNRETLSEADKVDVAYIPSTEDKGQVSPSPPPPQLRPSPPQQNITSRHWHDPHDLKAKAAKSNASVTKQLKKRSADRPTEQVRDVKDCRLDGLQPLLRKLNLSPPCDS